MSINCIPCMTCTVEAGIKHWVLKLIRLKRKKNTSGNLSSSSV